MNLTIDMAMDSEKSTYASYETDCAKPLNEVPIRHSVSSDKRRTGFFNKKVKKRLNGFLLKIEGDKAIVVIQDADNHYEYAIPIKILESAGISHRNQPFEMDYVVIVTDAGIITGQEFRPLASREHMTREAISLSSEEVKWRNLLLKEENDKT
ncbi:MAG: hypothetical protein WCS96_00225 [Victivallales bacterium]